MQREAICGSNRAWVGFYDTIFAGACVAIAGWAFSREQKQKRREADAAYERWLAVRQAYIAGIRQAEAVVQNNNEATRLIADEIEKQERILATEDLRHKQLGRYI